MNCYVLGHDKSVSPALSVLEYLVQEAYAASSPVVGRESERGGQASTARKAKGLAMGNKLNKCIYLARKSSRWNGQDERIQGPAGP